MPQTRCRVLGRPARCRSLQSSPTTPVSRLVSYLPAPGGDSHAQAEGHASPRRPPIAFESILHTKSHQRGGHLAARQQWSAQPTVQQQHHHKSTNTSARFSHVQHASIASASEHFLREVRTYAHRTPAEPMPTRLGACATDTPSGAQPSRRPAVIAVQRHTHDHASRRLSLVQLVTLRPGAARALQAACDSSPNVASISPRAGSGCIGQPCAAVRSRLPLQARSTARRAASRTSSGPLASQHLPVSASLAPHAPPRGRAHHRYPQTRRRTPNVPASLPPLQPSQGPPHQAHA